LPDDLSDAEDGDPKGLPMEMVCAGRWEEVLPPILSRSLISKIATKGVGILRQIDYLVT
jgi:hypothetical protein